MRATLASILLLVLAISTCASAAGLHDDLVSQANHAPRELVNPLLADAQPIAPQDALPPLGTPSTVAKTDPTPSPPVASVTPTATTFSVDVSTIVTGIFGLLGAIVTAFVPFIAARIMGALKVNQDSALGQVVESALRNGLNLGLAKAQAATKNWNTVTTHNEIVADGLDYVNKHAAEEAKKLGITQASIVEKLQSRLAAATNTANSVPVVVAAVPPAS